MAGHPQACARVGLAKEASNHVLVAGVKVFSGSTPERYQEMETRK